MDGNRPAPGPGGYGGLGAGSIVSKNIQPLLEADPRQIGPYAVRGRLGQGAMGSVYLGFAPSGQAFALKVLRQDFASDRDFRKRFTREIAAARAVHSPFVNAVTDADPNAATPWLASYFIPGPPLSSAVHLAGPFSPRSVAHLGVGIGLALQAIHTAGIVHRDLKPANVLVASDGPRVIDFGIARATDASMLTATGMRLGTPSFMAPEQVAGVAIEAPADVWAVGGMLIYAATGRTPFGDGNAMAILYRVENHEPDFEGLEPALAHIAARCLTKDPAGRPTPTQLVEMCRAALSGDLEGLPALRGSDVTGWLPAPVSRDLAARAAELANIGQFAPGSGAFPAAGVVGPGPGPDLSTGGAGATGATAMGNRTGGGLGGFLRRKGGGQPQGGAPSGQYSQGTAMSGGQGQYGQPGEQTGGGQYGPPPPGDPAGTGTGTGAGQQGEQYGGQQQGAFGGPYGGPPPAPQGYGGPEAGGQFGAPQPGGYGAPQQGGPGDQQQGGYRAPQPGNFGAPQQGGFGGQFGTQPSGQFAGQQFGGPEGGTHHGAPPPQGGFTQQPAAPAWGPSGPSGSDMATTIIPPNPPAPEPEGPAWRVATSSHAPATPPPAPAPGPPEPEPEPAGVAGLPAGFTPIGEEAKRLAESAETTDSIAAATSTPTPESAASDVDSAFGPSKPATGIPQIAEPTFATNFNIPAVTPTPQPDAVPPGPAPSFGIPQIAEPTFATNFNIPVVTPTPDPDAARTDEPQAASPTPAPSFGIPQIAEPTFATNFNIPIVTPTSEPDADESKTSAQAPPPAPAIGIPQIAEPTFATNFNIPVVTPTADSDEAQDNTSTPAPAPAGVSIPQIAEPTFATNFNIPVVTATDPNADTDVSTAPTGPPAVSIPSIAEPTFATGFNIPIPTPAETDPAPKPVTHAPPIPPHLQQPMTPPKGFTAPATGPQRQQPAPDAQAQQGQQSWGSPTQGQQPFAPSQPPMPPSPFAAPQTATPYGQQGQGQPQQPYADPAAQPQPPYAQQGQGQYPQQHSAPASQPGYQQPGQQPGYQPQQPPAPAPQQGYQQPQPGYQPQQHGGYQQPPASAPQPGYQPQPGQQSGQPNLGYQPQPGYQSGQQPNLGYQPQPGQQPGHHPNPQTPSTAHQAGGMTIVPLPPNMNSPYGVPERPNGPPPTLVDTDTRKGWAAWSRSKRIIVLAIAGIVVVGGIVGAILALSGGGSNKAAAPPATNVAATSQSPTTAAAAGPIGAQQGAPGARDVVLRGLYGAAADRNFQTVCASQTVAAQQGAAKDAGWNGQGDPMPLCEKYFQDNWSKLTPDYLRGRQVTEVKPGPAAGTMIVTVNDPPAAGAGSTRGFTVVWQSTHWLLEAANA